MAGGDAGSGGWPVAVCDLVPSLIVLLDGDGRIRRANRAFAELSGFAADELVGRDWFGTFVPHHDHDRIREVHQATLGGGATSGTVNPIRLRDGTERQIEWHNSAVALDDGPGTISVGVDVTERERQRRAQERRAALSAESERIARTGTWELDVASMQATWSVEVYRILEADPADVGDPFSVFLDRVHPEDRGPAMARFQAAVVEGRPLDEQTRLLFPDGRVKWIRQRAEAMRIERDEGGAASRMVGIIEDVTAEVAVTAARESERRHLRALVDAFPHHAAIFTPDGALVTANPRARQLSRRTEADAAVAAWDLPAFAEVRGLLCDAFARASKGERTTLEFRLERPEGPVDLDAEFCPLRDEQGVVAHIAAFALDVTTRNAALSRARTSEAMLVEAQRIARVGSWELDLVENHLTWSDEVYRIFEVDPTAFDASYEAFLSAVHPDDRARVDETYQASLATRAPYDIEHRLSMKDGRIKHVRERGETTFDDHGVPVRSIGTVADVTELVDAKERVRRVLDAMAPMVLVLGLDGTVLEANHPPLEVFGADREAVLGRPIWEIEALGSATQGLLSDLVVEASRGTPSRVDLAVVSHGRTRTLDASFCPARDCNERIVEVICSMVDVTARREAEDALRKSERRLAEAHRLAGLGAWERDLRTGVGWWSDNLYTLFGVNAAEPHTLEGLLSVIHPDDRERIRALEAQLADRGCWEGDFRIVRPDGELRHVHSVCALTREAGVPVLISGTHQDVTARRHAEERLQHTSTLLSAVIDSTPDLIFVKDCSYRYLLVNQAMARRVGSSVEAVIGQPDVRFFGSLADEGDPNRAIAAFHASDDVALAGEVVRVPTLPLEFGGEEFVYDVVKAPLRDETGGVFGVLGYARDVTQQRRTAESLSRSLREKETLLREIHHRVKNNLQIISSLLRFQAKKARGPEQLAVFSEARSRILAMILVHEKLYQSSELSRVAFGDYVRSLAQVLAQSFIGGVKVKVSVEADDLRLPLELALPSGMIVCELLTNVFKYAYPEATMGAARVRIRCEDDLVRLRVEDDGVGFPADFDRRSVGSFGWHLIDNLVDQLAGEITLENARGARVEVSFSLRRGSERP